MFHYIITQRKQIKGEEYGSEHRTLWNSLSSPLKTNWHYINKDWLDLYIKLFCTKLYRGKCKNLPLCLCGLGLGWLEGLLSKPDPFCSTFGSVHLTSMVVHSWPLVCCNVESVTVSSGSHPFSQVFTSWYSTLFHDSLLRYLVLGSCGFTRLGWWDWLL